MSGTAMFVYHQDPGHGWLQVPRQLLVKLGIEGKISVFSYLNGTTVYLEEDCDMSIFINAFKVQCPDVKLDIVDNHINVDASIRNMRPWPALELSA